MRDGTSYRVPPSGRVVVTDAAHVAELGGRGRDSKGSSVSDYAVEASRIGPVAAPGRECEACGWTGWAWSRICSRCQTPLDTSGPRQPDGSYRGGREVELPSE